MSECNFKEYVRLFTYSGHNFQKIERSSWYQIEAYGLGKFSIWKKVYVVHFERLVSINF